MVKKTPSIRILGLDPGTATTGWAVIDVVKKEISPVAYGFISTPKENSEEERILEIAEDLEKIIDEYQPDEAAIEKIFFFKNQKTVIQIAQARGVLLLTLSKKNVKVASYTPLQVKQALTSYGRAEKKQIQIMTKNLLHLESIPKPDDVADAIAICVCHSNSRELSNIIKR